MAKRLILLGLDGATFYLFGPWMEQGSLSNMARIAASAPGAPERSRRMNLGPRFPGRDRRWDSR